MSHSPRKLVVLLLIGYAGLSFAAKQKPSPAKAHSAAPAASASHLPTEATVNDFLKHMFGYDASISWKVESVKPAKDPSVTEVNVIMTGKQGAERLTFFVTPDNQYAISGNMVPFGDNPFAKARAELERGAHGPSKGPATASVTLVEFSDLQCPHCKEAQPTLEKLLAQEPNVRFISENFPLPSHNWAFKAASFADCVGRENNTAYWKFADSVYDQQQNITESNAEEKLTGLATAAGVNGKATAACAAEPATKQRVEQSIALGKEVGVTGTPTLYINGRATSMGIPVEVLKQIVDFAAIEK
ncbi:MAG TPA: thioredoxin domain-containing protein [Terriglobales bacterium]|jgi:protein-disulfide isomerase|nr:thioredoxin domain-containing protein [Terriglobales bacterium]